ncbi:MAG: epoxyqueuosine reductase [Syntrophaceae bacterium]|nr:epoxyqueuosine reductase [Syntrophaceae bacterium]
MSTVEEKIKDFVNKQGIDVVGLAGPERLSGPPSLDPTYTMRGAKSIISLAMPMNVEAIYDFLSKKTPVTHNTDQLIGNQKIRHIAERLASYIKTLGYRARAVPTNNNYRRSLDVYSTHPDFSHRFGAIVSGIGGQGMSGNIMTKEYGAAVYLSTVVTDAVLKSDPLIPPRYFADEYCKKCLICDKSCPAKMFEMEKEEYVLLNGNLHPRGKRRSVDLCNASCFGLHSLSPDKNFSSWGKHWISSWVGKEPDPEKENIRRKLLIKGASVGDSTVRYKLIRSIGCELHPEEWIDDRKIVPHYEDLPQDELEQRKIQCGLIKKYLGISIEDSNVLTCGNCALVCGPDIKESAKRLKLLRDGGIVVTGKYGRTVVVKTFEEAQKIREQYPFRVSRARMLSDSIQSGILWTYYYFGIEPKSILRNWIYQRKLRKAVKET